MTDGDGTQQPARRHHSLRERLDAAEVAAEEVVAEESGQLGGEVSALAVPFEELGAAVRAAIDPDGTARREARRHPAPQPEATPAPDEGAPPV